MAHSRNPQSVLYLSIACENQLFDDRYRLHGAELEQFLSEPFQHLKELNSAWV